MRCCVQVPIENPGVEKRIAEVGGGGGQPDGQGPCQNDRQQKKKAENCDLADDGSHRRHYTIANARTGNDPNPRTLTGTAKKPMASESGSDSRFVRWSTMTIPS